MSDEFTAVFPTNIRRFKGNPFYVDTPWGRPKTVAVGNVFDERDALDDVNNDLLAALKEIAWSNNSVWQADRARAAIARAEETAQHGEGS